MIVLVGFMGSGKTTVARMLGARLGLPYVDTDAVIERRSGRSIADIFRSDGEDAFRKIESDVVAETLAGPEAIVSVGGGAVTNEATRSLLELHQTVFLDVDPAEAIERARRDHAERPLLAAVDPMELYAQRKPLYEAVSTFSVTTSGRAPHEVAADLAQRLAPRDRAAGNARTVQVRTGASSYPVVVGSEVAARIAAHVDAASAEKAFVLTHPSLRAAAAPAVQNLETSGLSVEMLELDEGERSKSLSAAAGLYDRLAASNAHRNDLIVTFGGGVVSDVGGFVASTYMRGLPLVHLPSTLLGQVDAAIGGKTGVNLEHGKNLVGTIYQPRAVLCDVGLLATLSPEEMRSGLAEVLKCGFIADPSLIDLVVVESERIMARDPDLLVEVVGRTVAIKASIVATDEREAGDRAFLNYGHTFAHAIETVRGFGGIRHGEAVALGMVAAAEVARALGRIDDEIVDLHRSALAAVGLPVAGTFDYEQLAAAWQRDKKYSGGARFVLLKALGCPQAGVAVEEEVLRAALARLAREDGT